jgi:outer membrane protein
MVIKCITEMRLVKILLLAATFIVLGNSSYAQKFGYVDTEYILDMMPEYRSAQKQLDMMAEEWQKEMDKMQEVIDKMYRDLKAEMVLLTEDLRKKREQEIKEKDKQLKDYRHLKFGYEGELFKKRQELIKPIQDKIFVAIQNVAKKNAYDFIFAKSSDMIMLYSNARYDRSDEVLAEMGVTVNKNNKEQNQKSKQ